MFGCWYHTRDKKSRVIFPAVHISHRDFMSLYDTLLSLRFVFPYFAFMTVSRTVTFLFILGCNDDFEHTRKRTMQVKSAVFVQLRKLFFLMTDDSYPKERLFYKRYFCGNLREF